MHFWWASEASEPYRWLERGATAFFHHSGALRRLHTVWIYDTVARFRFDPDTGRCDFAVREIRLLAPAESPSRLSDAAGAAGREGPAADR
jgi:hypothetical protein